MATMIPAGLKAGETWITSPPELYLLPFPYALTCRIVSDQYKVPDPVSVLAVDVPQQLGEVRVEHGQLRLPVLGHLHGEDHVDIVDQNLRIRSTFNTSGWKYSRHPHLMCSSPQLQNGPDQPTGHLHI